MTADLQARAFALFDEALGWPEPSRADLLTDRCAGDHALREAVERLLRADAVGRRMMPTEIAAANALSGAIPKRIGVYRIDGVIGVGGMGAVVRGVRDDGLFEQTVAIKLIRPGLFDETAVARFADERRILARLKHPHIAQIIDGGMTENEAPYLVMDYLAGANLTQTASDRALPLAARLELFLEACDAVAHAHRALVVHADIKPSNILVTEDAGVKLLDFGIARLMDPAGRVSAAEAEPMTLAYAAPERRAGGPPSVAGDVYALGVVLYELLTGSLPERVTMTETRVLGGADPVQVKAPDWTAPSRTIPAELARLVPPRAIAGDLDAIVLKALKADPANRYEDVQALRDDIRLHLANRPVNARSSTEGWRYEALCFIRRHKLGLMVTTATMLALGLAAGISFWQFRQAETARAEAEQRFGQVRSLARFMLFDVYDALLKVPGSAESRLLIANASRRYLDELRAVKDAPVDVTLDAGIGYLRLAQVQGVSGASSFGDSRAAHQSLDIAQTLLAAVLRQQPRSADAHAELGWTRLARWAINAAPTYKKQNMTVLAGQSLDAALAIDPKHQRARLGRIVMNKNLAYDLNWANKNAEALKVAERALADLRAQQFTGRSAFEALIVESTLLTMAGDSLYYMNRPEDALVPYREGRKVLEAGRKTWGDTPQLLNALALTYWNIGGTYSDLPRYREQSLVELDQGLALLQRILSFGPDISAERMRNTLMGQKATNLSLLGRDSEALPLTEAVLSYRKARMVKDPDDETTRRDVAIQALHTAQIHARVGNRTRACALGRETLAIWERIERDGMLNPKDRDGDLPNTRAFLARFC